MRGTLMFTSPANVVADEERPGLLRALPAKHDSDGDVRTCHLRDLADTTSAKPGFEEAGFESVDLSQNALLQSALDDVRELDRLNNPVAAAIRASLDGTQFDLNNGKALRVDHVVEDGLFHRRSGPNGIDVNPGGMDGFNGHGGAEFVHGDQDVFGTPLRQLMHGAAPDMFRHITPDGRNLDAVTCLVNLWVPIHAPVQPLALMDRRTLDAPRHQLRYGLPVDSFLDRDEEATVNDIWNFLHDDGQQWHITSDMESSRGYVFDTLGIGHGAAILAGEDALAELYLLLHQACEAIDCGDNDALHAIATQQPTLRPPTDATHTIQEAWRHMSATHEAAGTDTPVEWRTQAQAAMSTVIRRSIEIRLVATLLTN